MRNRVIAWLVFAFFFTTHCMDDDRPAGVPAAMDNLPNSKRNTMVMTYETTNGVLLSINVDCIMYPRNSAASIIITVKGNNIDTEINRLYLDL